MGFILKKQKLFSLKILLFFVLKILNNSNKLGIKYFDKI